LKGTHWMNATSHAEVEFGKDGILRMVRSPDKSFLQRPGHSNVLYCFSGNLTNRATN